VGPAQTGVDFIDAPRQVYAWLVQSLGPVGAGVVAGVVFLILFVILIGTLVLQALPDR
jgi:hypothetical protein